MKIHGDYHKLMSKHLNEHFEIKIFGTSGKPLMVFPTSCGRFYDCEERGVISTLAPLIESKDIVVICVDSRDWQSWFKEPKDSWMGINHQKYEKCITEEIIPWLHKFMGINEKFITTGNSWGGYHALNFALKFPKLFDSAISLSGAYSLKMVIGEYYDDSVYFNDMLKYMPNLSDKDILQELKNSYLVICHGKGSWELCNHDAWELAQILGLKQIPHCYSVWDERYPHDWNSWFEQLPFFMDKFKNGVDTAIGKKIIIGPKRIKQMLKITM